MFTILEAKKPTITRPVYIMFDKEVEPLYTKAVLQGINTILRFANVEGRLPAHNFGVWRNNNWRQGVNLTEWNSIDWYIQRVERQSRQGQLDGDKLLLLLMTEPWQKNNRHYDVLVTNKDLYTEGCNFCIGLAIHEFGTIISTNRFQNLNPNQAYECIVTETIHEMGHVFGLIPHTRKKNVENSLGLHCTNKCVMRQGMKVPHDWLNITIDRLNGHNFCDECLNDLKNYFL
ncbi:MAG: hypothetical protein WDK96_02210 [Candidatus Paceibacterota bacterium]|jgi:predicted Zn-dependent protease